MLDAAEDTEPHDTEPPPAPSREVAEHHPVIVVPLASVWVFHEVTAYAPGFRGLVHDGAARFLVLDIGANIGAFALLARQLWPRATIRCYEPHPRSHELLARNVIPLGMTVYPAAVVGSPHGEPSVPVDTSLEGGDIPF